MNLGVPGLTLLAALAASPGAAAGSAPEWAALAADGHAVLGEVVYLTAEAQELRLDLYLPQGRSGASPTVLYFHGGGWIGGSRTTDVLMLLPYLERGFAVVNAEYRRAGTSLAPAAVEDARCALRWIGAHAQEHGFDLSRLIVTGRSAGGHLALMAGLLGADSAFDRRCPVGTAPRVAAVVNWFGIADVAALLSGADRQAYAVAWVGGAEDPQALGRAVSPTRHVSRGAPPVMTIHGDRDRAVPHAQALALHAALDAAGVPNRLHTVPGGGHANFDRAQTLEAYARVWAFLEGVVELR